MGIIITLYKKISEWGKSMVKISYNGAEGDFMHWEEITEEERKNLEEQYYQKPSFEAVKREFKRVSGGNTAITRYYFKDLMAKVKMRRAKWTIEEVFQSKDVLGIFVGRVHNQKFFTESEVNSEITKIETAIRVGGAGIAYKPANFPIKTVDSILKRYNVNGNYYDYSCGWGARLFSSLRNGVNYYGTDPNYLLVDRLKQLSSDYRESAGLFCPSVDIRTTGSEIFHSEWENKIGVCFSSPPYFDLEDYRIGEQSIKNNDTYDKWLEHYMKPTFENCYKYLVKDGYFIINIKNFDKHNMVDDARRLAEEVGFTFLHYETLNVMDRPNTLNNDERDLSEKIQVFKKN